MKNLIGCLGLLLFILCLSSPLLADEASYYYSEEGWLIRAYTETSNGVYAVYIEVRDKYNRLVSANISGLNNNPYQIATGAATNDISLAFDSSTATAYVFYTTQDGLQLAELPNIKLSGPRISVSPESLDFGDVSVGTTSDGTVTVSNTGDAALTLSSINVTGASFSRQGGTCSNNQTLLSGKNCTITVRFFPSGQGQFSGTLSIQSNGGNVTVSLSGNGVNQCNADLVIQSISLTNCCDNNKDFGVNITIKNQGTGSAGAFNVKGYISPDTNIGPMTGPPSGDTLLFTWNVKNGLSYGATASNQITARFSGYPIHQYYYLIFKVDADGQVCESNENNNTRTLQFPLSR